MIELVNSISAIILLIIAAIIDIKTKEVPNLISYSLIVIALSLKLIQSLITKDINYFLLALLGFIIFFILGILLYYAKQWGGGDAKLLMGIGAIFILYPKELNEFFTPDLGNFPFIATIILNIFIVGSLYSILWCIGLLIKNKSFFKIFKLTYKELINSKVTLIWTSFIIFTILIRVINKDFGFMLLVGTILATLTAFLLKIIKIIEKEYLIRQIPISKLTEGDWIINNIKIGRKIIYKPTNTGISNKDIIKIKKLKIKKVTIKEGIPFVPAITLGVIISIVLGNLIFIIT